MQEDKLDPVVTQTIGSPIDYYKFEILRDVINVKDAWENYSKNFSVGLPVDLGIIRARTQSLFNSLYAYLKRKIKPEDFDRMQKQLFDDPILMEKDLRKIFWKIQVQLDLDQITKLDMKRSYDGTRVELENQNFGMG